MKKCLIYSGGEYCRTEVKDFPDLVIACDKGLMYAQADLVRPDIILGNFDSFDGDQAPETLGAFVYPKEKDDTDTMLAVKYALENGCREITITCALGARLDHTIANIQAGTFIAEHGGRAVLQGKDDVIHVFSDGSILLPKREGWSLSVFSLSDRVTGVSIQGTKYSTDNAELTNGFPIGISNEWAEDKAEITVGTGVIMIIESRIR